MYVHPSVCLGMNAHTHIHTYMHTQTHTHKTYPPRYQSLLFSRADKNASLSE